MQRRKGANGERELAGALREAGHRADRTAPLQAGMNGEADVRTSLPGVFMEVKRAERLDIPRWLRELETACPEGREGVLAFRQSRQPWRVVISLDHYLSLHGD